MSIHFINISDIQQNFDAKTENKQPYVPQAITSHSPQHLGFNLVHHQVVGGCQPPPDASDALASTGQLQGKQRESISLHSLHPSGHPPPIPQLQDIFPAGNQ